MQNKLLTRIDKIDNVYIKRDDLYRIAEVSGGKARTCWHLSHCAKGLVTAGSRYSPQVAIAASIAANIGIECRIHIPYGDNTNIISHALNKGAVIVRHKPGYNSVIISRAKKDAIHNNYTYIPFGMECKEAIKQTAKQVENIPSDIRRVVVPVGSGMTLAGILTGMVALKINVPVVGIVVGANPIKRLDRYAPLFWRNMVKLIASRHKYSKSLENSIGDIVLDPIYEAKCFEYLHDGDLFWIVGCRNG